MAPDNSADDDLYNLEKIKAAQMEFAQNPEVTRNLTCVSLEKPKPDAWIRVNPDPAYMFETYLYRTGDDELYWVPPAMLPVLAMRAGTQLYNIFTAVTRYDEVFLWPIRVLEDGENNKWVSSAHKGAEMAQKQWACIHSGKKQGRKEYLVDTVAKFNHEPKWPNKTFMELFKMATGDATIDSPDHPVVKKLRGLE
jgi:hypothetical protein